MAITRFRIAVTTDAAGAFTGYTQGAVNGIVQHVQYTPDATNPLATGADLDITGEVTAIVVANHDNIGVTAFTKAYRQATHGVDGAAALYAAAGSAVLDKIAIAGERLKLVIAQGGNTLSGVFDIVVTDD
jgi:hypothetical protein